MKNLVILVAATLLGSAQASDTYGQYDFQYRIGNRLLVSQVFDDGQQTLIQLRTQDSVPTVIDQSDGHSRLVEPTARGAYWVIAGLSQRFTVIVGKEQAAIGYVGDQVRAEVQLGGMARPTVVGGVLRPEQAQPRTDKMPQAQLAVLRKPSGASLVLDESLAAPSTQSATHESASTPTKEEDCKWSVRPEDRHLSVVMSRWAKEAGYSQAFNELSEDPVLEASAQFCGPIENATDQLLSAVISATPIQVIFHQGNKTMQLTPGNR